MIDRHFIMNVNDRLDVGDSPVTISYDTKIIWVRCTSMDSEPYSCTIDEVTKRRYNASIDFRIWDSYDNKQ